MFSQARVILIFNVVDFAFRDEHIFASVLHASLGAVAVGHFRRAMFCHLLVLCAAHAVTDFPRPGRGEGGGAGEERAGCENAHKTRHKEPPLPKIEQKNECSINTMCWALR